MCRWFGMLFLAVALAQGGCDSSSSQISVASEALSQLPLGIIGQIEPVVIYPLKLVMEARIDTGATTSSIDARDVKIFERDGRRWARFYLIDRKTGKRHKMEKRLIRRVRILDQEIGFQRRPVVELKVGLGDVVLKRQFSLVDRTDFICPILIGRNVLQGQAMVDVSQSRTLKPEIVNGK